MGIGHITDRKEEKKSFFLYLFCYYYQIVYGGANINTLQGGGKQEQELYCDGRGNNVRLVGQPSSR